jgi:hypothetical protein
MTEPGWSFHPQLATDTVPVGELALSHVLAANSADYPWLIPVPTPPSSPTSAPTPSR